MLATTRVPASQISLYYYVGFCFLMMRRYKVDTHTPHTHVTHTHMSLTHTCHSHTPHTQDTLRTFSNIIVFIQRAKNHFQPKSYQQLQVIKQNEQMLNIIAMVVALNPQVTWAIAFVLSLILACFGFFNLRARNLAFNVHSVAAMMMTFPCSVLIEMF